MSKDSSSKSLEEQLKAAIKAYVDLKRELTSTKLDMGREKNRVTDLEQELRRRENELREERAKREQMAARMREIEQELEARKRPLREDEMSVQMREWRNKYLSQQRKVLRKRLQEQEQRLLAGEGDKENGQGPPLGKRWKGNVEDTGSLARELQAKLENSQRTVSTLQKSLNSYQITESSLQSEVERQVAERRQFQEEKEEAWGVVKVKVSQLKEAEETIAGQWKILEAIREEKKGLQERLQNSGQMGESTEPVAGTSTWTPPRPPPPQPEVARHGRNRAKRGQGYFCRCSQKKYSSRETFTAHLKKVLNRWKSKCATCSQRFQSERMLRRHWVRVHGGNSCQECWMSWRSGAQRRRRRRALRAARISRRILQRLNNGTARTSDSPGQILVRGLPTPNPSSTSEQPVYVRPKNFGCNVCNESFTSLKSLQLHQLMEHLAKVDHLRKNIYGCRECGAVLSSRKQLKSHRWRVHQLRKSHSHHRSYVLYPQPQELMSPHPETADPSSVNPSQPSFDTATQTSPPRHEVPRVERSDDDPQSAFPCGRERRGADNSTVRTGNFKCALCQREFLSMAELRGHIEDVHDTPYDGPLTEMMGYYSHVEFEMGGFSDPQPSANYSTSAPPRVPSIITGTTGTRIETPLSAPPPAVAGTSRQAFPPSWPGVLPHGSRMEAFLSAKPLTSKFQVKSRPDGFHCSCGQQCLELCEIVEHVYAHANRRRFRCRTCDQGFLSAGRLQIHMRRRHNIEYPIDNHNCDVCNDSFPTKMQLFEHSWKTRVRPINDSQEPAPQENGPDGRDAAGAESDSENEEMED